MKKLIVAVLVLAVLLAGCGKHVVKENKENEKTKEDKKQSIVVKDYDAKSEDDKEEEEKKKEDKKEDKKPEEIAGQHRDPNQKIVVIDPGHQLRGDSTKEPNGPGSSEMKARVSSGTTGVATRVPEYVMNLSISLKLKTELENRGYTVYMTRSTHDVNISNKERAQYASSVNADIAVRIHGNGNANQQVRGAEVYVPGLDNPYVSKDLATASNTLGTHVLNEYCKATGIKKRDVFNNNTMTGMNWSEVPVIILEVGYMSNPEEDQLLQQESVQNNMVVGIANGIDKYFNY